MCVVVCAFDREPARIQEKKNIKFIFKKNQKNGKTTGKLRLGKGGGNLKFFDFDSVDMKKPHAEMNPNRQEKYKKNVK